MNNKHLKKFPCMTPWIGKNYEDESHKRLLIMGESHYFPEGSTIQIDAQKWYNDVKQEDLNSKEQSYITTKEITNDAINNNINHKPFRIYKNIAERLNEQLNLDNYTESFEHVSFYNYFLRPAEIDGESINVKEIDKEEAKLFLKWFIEEFKPDLIAFTSSKAGDTFLETHQPEITCSSQVNGTLVNYNMPFVVCPHPANAHWNTACPKYGNIKGHELFSKFLIDNEWCK